ncbi:MAG: hypothetical protein HY305_06780 [Sphingobacteriales bacterium]|nr:hypothetical protein [Sphingobacteriales bacterium]
MKNKDKANYYRNLLITQFADSKPAKILTNPDAANPLNKNKAVSDRYEEIYNQFIEGNFYDAITQKKKADSLYGSNYWSPQLLYIEAIYEVKEACNDSAAIAVLNNLASLYPASPLKQKAERLAEVLKRREEIENYLAKLEVTRAKEEETIMINDAEPMVQKPDTTIAKTDTVKKVVIAPVVTVVIPKDTIKKIAPVINTTFTFNPTSPHYLIMILDKVDGTYVNEARNAFNRYNSDEYPSKQFTITKEALDNEHALLIFSPFVDADAAMAYYNKIKGAAKNEVSWLPANKYSFEIISEESLQLLRTNKNLNGYKNLLNAQYPGKF